MTCLETDFLIDIIRQRPEAIQKLKQLESTGEKLSITPITATELFEGGSIVHREKEMEKIESTIHSLQWLQYDVVAAQQAGELMSKLSQYGQKIGDLDTITAGIALRHNQNVIVTKNKKHFEKIPNLKIEGW
jgi:tRNA(fMet)-specific endonuclease VapC